MIFKYVSGKLKVDLFVQVQVSFGWKAASTADWSVGWFLCLLCHKDVKVCFMYELFVN